MLTLRQLLGLGLTPDAVAHRLATGRLHRVHTGVYAVGRRELAREGQLMAAVLRCGQNAVLSHESAAELWEIRRRRDPIEISVPAAARPRPTGITLHRRISLDTVHIAHRHGLPLTSPICTLVDLATRLTPTHLERAVNEAVIRDLTNSEVLRASVAGMRRRPGARALAKTLDARTLVLTDSVLEQRFLPIARAAGLPRPLTQSQVNGFRVDFYWAELGLIVETDGLRYHQTPAQQAKDRLRDQAHTAAGLTTLRFTHDQIVHAHGQVERTLRATATALTRTA